MNNNTINEIDFDKLGGVVPVVVQDVVSKEVLMVAFMSQEAFTRTVESGFMWYFSRKRKVLWKKGEQSGNFQIIKYLYLDCDNDTLLAEVEQIGGACDLGNRTCFDKKWQDNRFIINPDSVHVCDPSTIYPKYTEDLRIAVPTGSLEKCTRDLLDHTLIEKTLSQKNIIISGKLASFNGNLNFFGQDPREIPGLVASGTYDAGITGFDIALDKSVSVVPIANLGYNKRGRGAAVWALAVPNEDKISSIYDLNGKTVLSEIANVTRNFFHRLGLSVTVQHWNIKNHEMFFNGNPVVELMETGETMRRYGYRPLARVLVTHAILIANPASYGYTWKRRKIEGLAEALKLAVNNLPISKRPLFKFSNDSSTATDYSEWDVYRRAWFTRFSEENT